MEGQDVRVLLVLDAFDIGGTETHVLSLAKELIKQGSSVFVTGDPGPLESKFKMLNCKIYKEKTNKQKLENWIRINKINVIHAHLQSSGRIAVQLSQELNIPLVYTFHGIFYNPSESMELFKQCSIEPTLISVSVPVQNHLKQSGITTVFIPNGIDMKEFRPYKSNLRRKLNIPNKSKVILYASRLEDTKYEICNLLLDASEEKLLDALPNLYLLIAGGGMNAERIKKRINDKINSKRIQYIGNRKDMSELYSICDYVVGTGRVALEAISCECPVIAIGTEGTFGLVTLDNFNEALNYYFCDHKCYLPMDQKHITKAILDGVHYKVQHANWKKELRQNMKKSMDISIVTKRIFNIYRTRVLEMREK
ncbi:glycosyltransferase [Paenibacillus sp. WQ 127069]|uniref:Glycosyltransferase n=1 Tax=Paenibacillus baimaensis TaxID=2982185 RepID=A0ABT2UBD3_9BACL|nr:glycosyltransferase [Paenibacillus sp. WQ 127069]MCU6791940.1 glycosyltransferase [Paenibacillus sp. WQ 127069]